MEELKRQSIALMDKVKINGIQLVAVEDWEILISSNATVKTYNNNIDEMQHLSMHIEKTIMFDLFSCHALYDESRIYCGTARLELSIPDDGYHNLNCFTPEEYAQQLDDVADYLRNMYGIIISVEYATYSYLEINKTICLDDTFSGYDRVLALLMNILPPRLRLGAESDYSRPNYAANVRSTPKQFETFIRSSGKNGITVTIYDKSRELYVRHKITVENQYLRLEIRLNCAAKIREAFGTNKVLQLSQEVISTYFDAFVAKNFVNAVAVNTESRLKIVLKLLRSGYASGRRKWIEYFIIELLNMEIENGHVPILLDINELYPLLSKVSFGSKQIRYNAKKRLLEVCQDKASCFTQLDGIKLQEVLYKLSAE